MKSKKATYILFPLVVLIWGYVAYSIVTYGEPETDLDPIRVGDIVAEQEQQKKARPLQLDYPDPFLKRVSANRLRKASEPGTKPIKKVKKEPEVNWGNIVYNGYIRNNQKKTKIALLNIDGKQFLGQQGESYLEKTIRSIQQDSVQLQFGVARKWFTKSKK